MDQEWSGGCSEENGRRYDRDFKITVVAEFEVGKPHAQIAHER